MRMRRNDTGKISEIYLLYIYISIYLITRYLGVVH